MEPAEITDIVESLLRLHTLTKKVCQPSVQKEFEVLLKKMHLLFVEQAVVAVMSHHYDFGPVSSVSRLFGGLENQNYLVETNDGRRRYRFFIKRYRKKAGEKEILLEHKFNQHLTKIDFPEIAKVIPSKNGSTFVTYPVAFLDSSDTPSTFAVYSYLEGEDRYAWRTPYCTMPELASASNVLAKIHERSFGFDARGYTKEEPKIIQLMGDFPVYFSEYEKLSKGRLQKSKSAIYFLEKLPSYLKALQTCQVLRERCEGMLELNVHGDYHPGNQKYSGDCVSGVFDFDWCKEDLRLFDVALSITYFCTSWKAHENGVLFLDEVKVFLESYQKRLKNSDRIFPLTKEELAMLPEMILLANMYVIWWDLKEIFEVKESESDVDKCLEYIDHNTKINDFALANLEEIRMMVMTINA